MQQRHTFVVKLTVIIIIIIIIIIITFISGKTTHNEIKTNKKIQSMT